MRVLFDTMLLGEEKWLFQLLNYSFNFTAKVLLSCSRVQWGLKSCQGILLGHGTPWVAPDQGGHLREAAVVFRPGTLYGDKST